MQLNVKKCCVLLVSILIGLLIFTGCPNMMNSGAGENDNAGENVFFDGNFAGYKWTIQKGQATLSAGDELVISKSDSYGIAVQLADEELTAITAAYGNSFYVESYVKINEYVAAGEKNFGLASHIGKTSSGVDNFYYAGINFNGCMQLGTKITAKGVQFGSLASNTALFKQTEQFWKLRYEYNNGLIKGYVNDIQFVKAYNGDGLDSYTIPSVETVGSGSIGFVTSGESFSIKSFKVGALNTGKAGIRMTCDSAIFDTLTENTTAFVMMMINQYEGRIGDEPITVSVTATDDSGAVADWTVASSDSTIITAVKTGDGTAFVLTPVSVGNAVVTVTNSSDTKQTRIFSCNIKDALGFTDTDYNLTEQDVYPAVGSADVYEDSRFSITFDSVPVLNAGEIIIFASDGTTEVDRIQIGTETDTLRDGTASGSYTFTLKNFMVQVDGNTVHMIPHSGVLQPKTEYVIGIENGVITGTLNGKAFTGFDPAQKRWSFTTRTVHIPENPTALKVGMSEIADYRTIQAAVLAAYENAVISVEEGSYREIVYYRGGKNMTITGPIGNDKGANCVITGINCNAYNSSSHTRASFYWSGSDLTLKNLTIQNAYDRNTDGTAQSEALYFANGTGKKLVAYNCSFKGHQDTIQTSGKNWFYKCYIEGDTDFIWGTADVALFEECMIKMLNTSADTVKASDSIIFETRVGSTSENFVPKGYVLFNSFIAAEHPSSYFARRATNKASTSYYDQVAIINSKVTGSLNDELWLSQNVKADKNLPEYIVKDGNGNMNIGWKVYGGSGYSTAKMNTYEYAGTLSAAVYNKEYNGRKTILNRVFRKSSGMYENTAEIWDISMYETEFNAVADNSTIDDVQTVSGANGEYAIAAFATDTTPWAAIPDGTSQDTYVSWNNIVYHSAGYGAAVKTGTGTITIQLAGKSVVSFIGSSYSNGTISVSDSGGNTVLALMSTKTAADKNAFAFIYEGTEATTITLSITGTTYIGTITVSEWVDEVKAVTQVTVNGASSVAVGQTVKMTAAVTAKYCADPSVTWHSSDSAIASVDVNGTVTGVTAGTATITAVSVFDPAKSGSVEITVTAVGLQSSDSFVWTAADYNASGKAIQNTMDTWNTLYVDATNGKFTSNGTSWIQVNTGTQIYVPVFTDAKIIITTYTSGLSIDGFSETETGSKKYTRDFMIADATEINGQKYCLIQFPSNNYIGAIFRLYDKMWTQSDYGTSGLAYNGTAGLWDGLYVDASNGKFTHNGSGWIQCNTNTIVYVPIVADALITVTGYAAGYTITNGTGGALTDNGDKTYTYSCPLTDAVRVSGADGVFAKIIMGSDGYLCTISLKY